MNNPLIPLPLTSYPNEWTDGQSRSSRQIKSFTSADIFFYFETTRLFDLEMTASRTKQRDLRLLCIHVFRTRLRCIREGLYVVSKAPSTIVP